MGLAEDAASLPGVFVAALAARPALAWTLLVCALCCLVLAFRYRSLLIPRSVVEGKPMYGMVRLNSGETWLLRGPNGKPYKLHGPRVIFAVQALVLEKFDPTEVESCTCVGAGACEPGGPQRAPVQQSLGGMMSSPPMGKPGMTM
eukprot:CAMPEP_0204596718 /NCGR_PEP_ID=MMETSP0661-20131031/53398_1 /ASSEMBLY_ACC=CAM_ASM_000606 /TAXON_ID=109239 /ORGANISM="Alexandrium margalefi, Strain AMGDE01CS-322" /LENGTH=144 /DNA_ID=CAMNT_0051607347 /DNA_START=54 /DNA_END=488 /DNA_ORIENTATION=+